MCKITLYVSMDTRYSLTFFLVWLIAFVACCFVVVTHLYCVVLFLFLGLYQIWSIRLIFEINQFDQITKFSTHAPTHKHTHTFVFI